MNPTPEPQTFTIEEAARILRIGRTAAYALARQWRTTGGRSGLPRPRAGTDAARSPRRAHSSARRVSRDDPGARRGPTQPLPRDVDR